MDPVTIALIAAAILAARGIKRGAAPPARRSSQGPEVAVPASFGFPAPAFGGGLRPPVTHKAITGERVVEGSAEARGGDRFGAEPASPGGLPPGLGRAETAIASGVPADFAGAPASGGGGSAQARPGYFYYLPPSGKWQGGIVQGGPGGAGVAPGATFVGRG